MLVNLVNTKKITISFLRYINQKRKKNTFILFLQLRELNHVS